MLYYFLSMRGQVTHSSPHHYPYLIGNTGYRHCIYLCTSVLIVATCRDQTYSSTVPTNDLLFCYYYFHNSNFAVCNCLEIIEIIKKPCFWRTLLQYVCNYFLRVDRSSGTLLQTMFIPTSNAVFEFYFIRVTGYFQGQTCGFEP